MTRWTLTPFAKLLFGIHDEDGPVHRPGPAWEAPIPGTHWYAGCEPDKPRVSPYTGLCEGCGEPACRVCGRSNCPDGCDDD